jgi:hypothetical protein
VRPACPARCRPAGCRRSAAGDPAARCHRCPR